MFFSMLRSGEMKKLSKAKIVFLCHDANRAYIYEGKRYSQLIDSINERLIFDGIKTITLATPYSKHFGDAAFGNVFPINGIMLRAIIIDKICRMLRLKSNRRIEAWGRLLDYIKPQIIIGIQPTPEMCIATQLRGIIIYDLQHGLVYDPNGYYVAGYREKYNQKGWPDCILCWDQSSADFIKLNAPYIVKTRVIGNPWVLRYVRSHEGDHLVRSHADQSLPSISNRNILVTLQWGKGQRDERADNFIPRALIDVIKADVGQCIWWLRLHPIQMQGPLKSKIYRSFEQEFKGYDHVFWEQASEAALPFILKQATLHLTKHSAVTVEAAWFGVVSGLLGANHDLLNKWFAKEISGGLAQIIEPDVKSIQEWILSHLFYEKDYSAQKCKLSLQSFEEFALQLRSEALLVDERE